MDFGNIIIDGARAAFGVEAVVFALAAIGLNIHFGYTGLLNFGQVGFMLVGAYGVAIMARSCPGAAATQTAADQIGPCGQPLLVGVITGIVLAVILALLLGAPTLRLRADYLAITTIAAGEILRFVFRSDTAQPLTNSVFGIQQFAGDFFAINPIPPAGDETAAPFVGVQGFYLSSQSANALLATEFLVNYLGTEDAQRALYEADPRIPAYSTLAEEVSSDPVIEGFLASAQNGVPMPSIPEMGSVWDFWNAAESQIMDGADPEETWSQMVTDLEASLNE